LFLPVFDVVISAVAVTQRRSSRKGIVCLAGMFLFWNSEEGLFIAAAYCVPSE
jgi:hypothetical protein